MSAKGLRVIPLGWVKQSDGSYSQPKTLKEFIGKSQLSEPLVDAEAGKSQKPNLFVDVSKPKRIRQCSKPLLNKLEQEFHFMMLRDTPGVLVQAVTFRLANGVRYTPDFFCFGSGLLLSTPTAWEVKGPWFPDDAKVKVKTFAMAYPFITTLLAWKENGLWVTQQVLP